MDTLLIDVGNIQIIGPTPTRSTNLPQFVTLKILTVKMLLDAF
jgi:hypothetical protein